MTISPTSPGLTGSSVSGLIKLDQKVVLGDMQAVPLHAFACNAGAHHFGQAVVVRGDDLELAFELLPHGIGPGLGAEEPVLQGQSSSD